VIGTIPDRAHASGSPKEYIDGVQIFGMEDRNRAIIEFTVLEAGTFLCVDQDHFGYMATGFVAPFVVN
jgi:hypothetical protein